MVSSGTWRAAEDRRRAFVKEPRNGHLAGGRPWLEVTLPVNQGTSKPSSLSHGTRTLVKLRNPKTSPMSHMKQQKLSLPLRESLQQPSAGPSGGGGGSHWNAAGGWVAGWLEGHAERELAADPSLITVSRVTPNRPAANGWECAVSEESHSQRDSPLLPNFVLLLLPIISPLGFSVTPHHRPRDSLSSCVLAEQCRVAEHFVGVLCPCVCSVSCLPPPPPPPSTHSPFIPSPLDAFPLFTLSSHFLPSREKNIVFFTPCPSRCPLFLAAALVCRLSSSSSSSSSCSTSRPVTASFSGLPSSKGP
ncbi:hypothetical protein E2C01_023685 [Portunus trituberculatus]|uniref:Uncharacterized protein n=1 Tax=Portunus trituberculatus TaxID=210409 RepID=A0A5B7E8N0_PORTR|nr:hypothetical protein [Portunus trituberculatus]